MKFNAEKENELINVNIHGKNGFAERSKIFWIRKVTLLHYQNNYVEHSN